MIPIYGAWSIGRTYGGGRDTFCNLRIPIYGAWSDGVTTIASLTRSGNHRIPVYGAWSTYGGWTKIVSLDRGDGKTRVCPACRRACCGLCACEFMPYTCTQHTQTTLKISTKIEKRKNKY